MPYKYAISQKVRIKKSGDGHTPPPESVRGEVGAVAEQLTMNWAGTRLELEAGVTPKYYVEFTETHHELIGEDWLEPYVENAQ